MDRASACRDGSVRAANITQLKPRPVPAKDNYPGEIGAGLRNEKVRPHHRDGSVRAANITQSKPRPVPAKDNYPGEFGAGLRKEKVKPHRACQIMNASLNSSTRPVSY